MSFYGQLWRHWKDETFLEQSEKSSQPLTPSAPDARTELSTGDMQVEDPPKPKRKKPRSKKTKQK